MDDERLCTCCGAPATPGHYLTNYQPACGACYLLNVAVSVSVHEIFTRLICAALREVLLQRSA